MEVHVICCNDSVEFAVIGDIEKANSKMAELKATYYERNKGNFRDENAYGIHFYWHIHTVNGEMDLSHEARVSGHE